MAAMTSFYATHSISPAPTHQRLSVPDL